MVPSHESVVVIVITFLVIRVHDGGIVVVVVVDGVVGADSLTLTLTWTLSAIIMNMNIRTATLHNLFKNTMSRWCGVCTCTVSLL